MGAGSCGPARRRDGATSSDTVPVRVLFEHLEAGHPLEVVLEDFTSVTRELAVGILEDAKRALEIDSRPG